MATLTSGAGDQGLGWITHQLGKLQRARRGRATQERPSTAMATVAGRPRDRSSRGVGGSNRQAGMESRKAQAPLNRVRPRELRQGPVLKQASV